MVLIHVYYPLYSCVHALVGVNKDALAMGISISTPEVNPEVAFISFNSRSISSLLVPFVCYDQLTISKHRLEADLFAELEPSQR